MPCTAAVTPTMDESNRTLWGGVAWGGASVGWGAGHLQHDRITADDDVVFLRDRSQHKVVRGRRLQAIKNNRATAGGHTSTSAGSKALISAGLLQSASAAGWGSWRLRPSLLPSCGWPTEITQWSVLCARQPHALGSQADTRAARGVPRTIAVAWPRRLQSTVRQNVVFCMSRAMSSLSSVEISPSSALRWLKLPRRIMELLLSDREVIYL